MADEPSILEHYGQDRILERVLDALRASGVDPDRLTPDALAPVDHLHARGHLATEALAEVLAPQAGERVLDIGCGVGGPARWLTAHHGCAVAGIDISPAFCAAGRTFTELTGLTDKVRIVRGDACALPFEDACFDLAYSQYVIMNIVDKDAFYAEAARVLRPGGRFMMSAVTRGPGPAPRFPLPWARQPGISHLITTAALREGLEGAGFEIVRFHDCTTENAAGHRRQLEKIASDGPPLLGPRLVMGDHLPEAQRNSAAGYETGALVAIETLCVKG